MRRKRKLYVKPTSPVTDKTKIIEFAEDYLVGSNNEFVEMNDFIQKEMQCTEPHGNTNFIGDIAYKMRNTGRYELKENNKRYVIYKKEKKPFQEKFWWLISLITLTAGWFGDIGKEEFLHQEMPQYRKSVQATPTKPDTLHSLNNDKMEEHMENSIPKTKKDTLAKYYP